MLKPEYLKAGSRIRIISPAGFIAEDKVSPAVELLQQEGFEVILGRHVFTRSFQFAGTDTQRLWDLQEAFDDPLCKAVICSRGGYGTIRFAGNIDFTGFRKHPKWLVGFSDITVLHSRLRAEGFCSIHGPMPAFYLSNGQPSQSFLELMNLLRGKATPIHLPPHPLNRTGSAKARLTGGNLSLLYSLMGTAYETRSKGNILFIEDVSEYLYSIDRMMQSLKLAGKLQEIGALAVGRFSELKDNEAPFGQTAEEIIAHAVKDFPFPTCFGIPSGHEQINLPLMLGAQYSLNVTGDGSVLQLNND
ncbi:MAG: LD-carboxypeptidase [Mangrovibacterium sp.]